MKALTTVALASLATGLAATAPTSLCHAGEPFDPFSAESSWRTPIPAGAQLDPNSDAMIARATRDGAVNANLVEFGIPIYHVTSGTPRYAVECTVTAWGTCPFAGRMIPIPEGARPHSGSDGAMVVVDDSAGTVFEFWRARRTSFGWTTGFGAINQLEGPGWGGASTGSGASRLAGVIRLAEVSQGAILHALAIQTDNACAGNFRPPALKTDGESTRSDCIPEGARIRLDPMLDLDELNLSPIERMIARTLQTYGAYVIDRGGTELSVSFQLDPTANGDFIGETWMQAGLKWDYDNMSEVPWHHLQVLR